MQLLRKYDRRAAGRAAQADNESFEEEMTKLEFQIMDAENPED